LGHCEKNQHRHPGGGLDHYLSRELFERNVADFIKMLDQALEATRGLAASPEASSGPAPEKTCEQLPTELAEEAIRRIQEAMDMGDMSMIAAITDELASRAEAFIPFKTTIVQLVEDFDLDGIAALLGSLRRPSD
jgi:hypothetical protein